jgi:hypothetical protein
MEEYAEDALEIVNYLTYCSPQITPRMWMLFRPLCR